VPASYIIKGGAEGRARLAVLAEALEAHTGALLDRAGIVPGVAILDAGCGSGEVTRALALRTGVGGRVVGVDLDRVKLEAARELSASFPYVSFAERPVGAGQLADLGPFDVVYSRFLLSHLTSPEAALAEFASLLVPGGLLIVEDVDFAGHFASPTCPPHERYVAWYTETAVRHGVDANIGRRLPALVEAAGFAQIVPSVAQPYGNRGPMKQIAWLTLAAVADSIVDAKVATRAEVDATLAALKTATDDPAQYMSMTRIVQVVARKPRTGASSL
jgi:2-polyprenyl-3-methyl-5-hydroxy-6-metoxy-1,4-benzoquinol methylase